MSGNSSQSFERIHSNAVTIFTYVLFPRHKNIKNKYKKQSLYYFNYYVVVLNGGGVFFSIVNRILDTRLKFII